jgi:hypothetical protein
VGLLDFPVGWSFLSCLGLSLFEADGAACSIGAAFGFAGFGAFDDVDVAALPLVALVASAEASAVAAAGRDACRFAMKRSISVRTWSCAAQSTIQSF